MPFQQRLANTKSDQRNLCRYGSLLSSIAMSTDCVCHQPNNAYTYAARSHGIVRQLQSTHAAMLAAHGGVLAHFVTSLAGTSSVGSVRVFHRRAYELFARLRANGAVSALGSSAAHRHSLLCLRAGCANTASSFRSLTSAGARSRSGGRVSRRSCSAWHSSERALGRGRLCVTMPQYAHVVCCFGGRRRK